MFNKPYNQTKLIGFYEEFNLLKNLFRDKNKSNKLLFTGIKGIGKSTLAYHLINYIFSFKENYIYDDKNNIINIKNRSYNLVSNNSHPNLFIINIKENKSFIDISQIREMNVFSNKSSFNNDTKVVLIDNVELLNKSSSNSLLKILEDENPKLLFILIHNSRKKILETIKSRCLKFNFKLNEKSKNELLNIFIKSNKLLSLNENFFTHYSSPGELINFYNFCINNKIDYTNCSIELFLKNLLNNKTLFNDPYIKDNISNFIELYFYKNFLKNKNNSKFNDLRNVIIRKINLFKKFNLDIESLLLDLNNVLVNE